MKKRKLKLIPLKLKWDRELLDSIDDEKIIELIRMGLKGYLGEFGDLIKSITIHYLSEEYSTYAEIANSVKRKFLETLKQKPIILTPKEVTEMISKTCKKDQKA